MAQWGCDPLQRRASCFLVSSLYANLTKVTVGGSVIFTVWIRDRMFSSDPQQNKNR